jgi:3-oxoacyl-[acyl-carrier protein] reductase
MILKGKIALVTGASRGVGAAISKVLAQEGATVCVNFFKSQEKANQVVSDIQAQGGSAFTCYADVTNFTDTEKMIGEITRQYGRLDIVVNNALPTYEFNPAKNYVSIETVTWENFTTQFEGTVGGVINTTKAALPIMKQQQSGKIINISTNLVYNPVVTYYDYTAAKSALIGLSRMLSAELGKYGITVNLIAGGLLSITDASRSTTKEVFEYIASVTPLRKVTTVEDFAKSVLLFTSEWSNAITGQSLAVDGGLTMP